MNSPLILTDPSGLQAGSYVGRVYYNAQTGAFGNRSFAEEYNRAHPDTKMMPYAGEPRIVTGTGGYLYRLEPYGAMQLGIPGAIQPSPLNIDENTPIADQLSAGVIVTKSGLNWDILKGALKTAIYAAQAKHEYDNFMNDPQIQFAMNASIIGAPISIEAKLAREIDLAEDALTVRQSTSIGRSAGSTVPTNTGSYLHRFASGRFYAGKGPEARMNRTGRQLSREYGDPVVNSDFYPATSDRAGFIKEHELMMENGGPLTFDKLSPTYNRIHSPGCRFFCP